jgi:glycosyltransferase involved in cell wall biosynthesis
MHKNPIHIIFYGYHKSFDYYKIGGLESFYRRMAFLLSEADCKVSFVFYGSAFDDFIQITNSISLRYFQSFQDSIDYLATDASLVFDNYILKKHRLRYASFRMRHNKSIHFGHIYTGVPEGLQQKIIFISRKITPFNGPVLSLSHTIQKKLSKHEIDSDVMLPPLPQAYCIRKEEKKDRLRLTFMGRFDDNKGIQEVVSLFQKLSQSDFSVDMAISGYFAHGQVHKEKLEKAFDAIPNLEVQKQTWQKWSPEMDEYVISLLQKTDILILPYHNLQGTMDPPLLVLEGMACGCAILTTNVGSVKEFYGNSRFICEHNHFVERSYEIISQIFSDKNILEIEQERVAKKVKSLQNSNQLVVNYLVDQYRSIDV